MSLYYFEKQIPQRAKFNETDLSDYMDELFNFAYLKHTKDKNHIYYLYKEELSKLWKSYLSREELYKCKDLDNILSEMYKKLTRVLLKSTNCNMIYVHFLLALFGIQGQFKYNINTHMLETDGYNFINYYTNYLYSNIINDSTYIEVQLLKLSKEVEELAKMCKEQISINGQLCKTIEEIKR